MTHGQEETLAAYGNRIIPQVSEIRLGEQTAPTIPTRD
jgi:cell division protein ZapA (FtsZ GTPase activity inhibitor)